MATVTINGTECVFDGKKMILEVANEHGVEIPHYCYHPGLSIVASCRICLAEVEQPNPRNDNKVELIPKLLPTCQTPAVDGMIVHTKSPKAVANQKAVMEYLLINHPLDCPVCDQAGECYLQDYSYRYGRSESRFLEEKIKQPVKDLGPHVKLYADRCIMCSRCVRFTREVTATHELAVIGRGNTEQIDVFPGRPLNNELSGNVVDICPVGALLDKDFLFTQRVWFLTRAPSIDGLTASGDNLWVEHNEGKIYRVKPRTNLAVNKWWISDEIRYGWKALQSDERLDVPRRQQYGEAVTCTWQRAYDQVAAGFKQAAGLALLVSPMLTCEEAFLLAKLVRGLDENAVLAVGPIPGDGEDMTFPGGYTIYAEKCPNSRGVRRALQIVAGESGQVLDAEQFIEALAERSSKVDAVLLTGNYADQWAPPALTKTLGKRMVVLLDTLHSPLAGKAELLLPSVPWLEKAGTFENAEGRLQSFEPVLAPQGQARSEGQIAIDLAAACGLGEQMLFDAAAVRAQMAGPFVDQVNHPQLDTKTQSAMQYVEL